MPPKSKKPPARSWAIQIEGKARKEFRRLDAQMRARILDALDALASDPVSAPGVKALKGRDAYRLRVGDYRVIYEIDGDELVVLVLRVAHRREVYR